MPIKTPNNLPANDILRKENIFFMEESRACSQDIRPLKIIILNLMPAKQTTEVQLLRLIGNTPLQVEAELLHMESHQPKNTPAEYLDMFYKKFDEICHNRYDGMIITGAPIEHLAFEEVNYWKELTEIMAWTLENVTSTFHICWGAQAALYHHHGIQKYPLDEKVFGIFPHTKKDNGVNLLRGFDDIFFVPHSRYTEVREDDLLGAGLDVLSTSPDCGLYLAKSANGAQIYVTGHSEYDRETLKIEFERDLAKGLKINIPMNYFPGNDPSKEPMVNWRSHANLLFSNWLNYYVYQETPFDLTKE